MIFTASLRLKPSKTGVKMTKYLIIAFLLFGCWIDSTAQSPYILRGDQAYHSYDRAEILKLADTSLISSINNFNRKELISYFKKVWENDDITQKDKYDLMHVFSDNYEFLDDHVVEKKIETKDENSLFRSVD